MADRRFRDAIVHAAGHVPHYRDALKRMGVDPRELRGVADIPSLPLIEREQLHDSRSGSAQMRFPSRI